MIIASQNLANFNIDLPSDVVFRINLAWVSSVDELIKILKTHHDKKIFLDLPIGRLKPPNNKYSMDDLIPIINEFTQIRYFAVSNVESSADLQKYIDILPDYVSIVPKIESPTAVTNIEEIVNTHAEIGLPAAIGCGELMYEQLKNSSQILLDCKNHEILILEHSKKNDEVEARKILKSLGYIR